MTADDHVGVPLFDRPIIVLGAPRSGTSMIFQGLSAHPDLWSLYRESQPVIQPVYPVRMEPGHSARVTADDIEPAKVAALQQAFFAGAGNAEGRYARLSRGIPMILRARLSGFTTRLGQAGKRPPIRFVEKTPENCLRVDLCEAVFPDAQYVFVTRDPRGSISSLHHGWSKESRFKTRPFPAGYRLKEYDGDHWCFALIPAWEELNGARLVEVCARQWIDTNEFALAELPDDPARVMTVRYEDLVATTGETLDAIAAWTGLDPEPLRRFRDGLPVVNTWSAPRDDKWKRVEDLLDSVDSLIAPMRERLGYTSADAAG